MSGDGTYGACCACNKRVGWGGARKAIAYAHVYHDRWRLGIR